MFTLSPGRWVALLSLAACLASTGCGGGGDKLYTVKGKVLLNDAELKAGNVTFLPDTAKKNTTKNSPMGQIGADGTYTISTEGKSGAPAGWYKVTVVTNMPGMGAQTPDTPKASKVSAAPTNINAKYSDPLKTDLAVEVVASPSPTQYDLKVTR
jgi:hypothetical protein